MRIAIASALLVCFLGCETFTKQDCVSVIALADLVRAEIVEAVPHSAKKDALIAKWSGYAKIAADLGCALSPLPEEEDSAAKQLLDRLTRPIHLVIAEPDVQRNLHTGLIRVPQPTLIR